MVELTLLLPVGSTPGPYDVQVVDAERRSLASTEGEAAIHDFVTTLQATLDPSEVTSGNYRLALRRTGDGWRDYPTLVRRP
jgi:hypothetical protein